jgi:sporulation and cell division protein SsgA
MSVAHHMIRHRLVLELVGPDGTTPMVSELRYDPSDPYAVEMAFLKGDVEVAWVFARDLLMRGLSEPVGDGDVQVFPSIDDDGRAVVEIALRAPTGEALVEGRVRDVLEFLAQTLRVVWPGTERDHHMGTDDAIAALLVGD